MSGSDLEGRLNAGESISLNETCELLARLTEQRDELLAACEAVEWLPEDGFFERCPSCGAGYTQSAPVESRTHRERCQLAAALAKAKPQDTTNEPTSR